MRKRNPNNLTPAQVAWELFESMGEIDWCYANGGGLSQARLSASRVIAWCEAMDWPVPEGTYEASEDA